MIDHNAQDGPVLPELLRARTLECMVGLASQPATDLKGPLCSVVLRCTLELP
jgi:hypothetical protein